MHFKWGILPIDDHTQDIFSTNLGTFSIVSKNDRGDATLPRSSYSPVARYSEHNFITEYITESTLRAILKYIFMYTYIEIHTCNSKPMWS